MTLLRSEHNYETEFRISNSSEITCNITNGVCKDISYNTDDTLSNITLAIAIIYKYYAVLCIYTLPINFDIYAITAYAVNPIEGSFNWVNFVVVASNKRIFQV